MSRLIRLTLLWLLAAALPLQGLSAATMLSCAGGQHDHAATPVLNHSHGSSAAAARSHTHAVQVSQHEHAGADHTQTEKSGLGKSGAHKCSACASCCLNAVLQTEAVVFDTAKLPDSYAPLVARAPVTHVTEGLERPPRLFLA